MFKRWKEAIYLCSHWTKYLFPSVATHKVNRNKGREWGEMITLGEGKREENKFLIKGDTMLETEFLNEGIMKRLRRKINRNSKRRMDKQTCYNELETNSLGRKENLWTKKRNRVLLRFKILNLWCHCIIFHGIMQISARPCWHKLNKPSSEKGHLFPSWRIPINKCWKHKRETKLPLGKQQNNNGCCRDDPPMDILHMKFWGRTEYLSNLKYFPQDIY